MKKQACTTERSHRLEPLLVNLQVEMVVVMAVVMVMLVVVVAAAAVVVVLLVVVLKVAVMLAVVVTLVVVVVWVAQVLATCVWVALAAAGSCGWARRRIPCITKESPKNHQRIVTMYAFLTWRISKNSKSISLFEQDFHILNACADELCGAIDVFPHKRRVYSHKLVRHTARVHLSAIVGGKAADGIRS